MLSVCSVAVPERLIAQGAWPCTVAVALADHAMELLAPSVALAEPAIWTLPKHVALNVPEPVLPVNDVTAHEKLVHDCARFPPGTWATVTHVPPSIDDVLLGEVTVLLDLKQPALSRAADATTARIRFMFELAF